MYVTRLHFDFWGHVCIITSIRVRHYQLFVLYRPKDKHNTCIKILFGQKVWRRVAIATLHDICPSFTEQGSVYGCNKINNIIVTDFNFSGDFAWWMSFCFPCLKMFTNHTTVWGSLCVTDFVLSNWLTGLSVDSETGSPGQVQSVNCLGCYLVTRSMDVTEWNLRQTRCSETTCKTLGWSHTPFYPPPTLRLLQHPHTLHTPSHIKAPWSHHLTAPQSPPPAVSCKTAKYL